MSETTEKNDHYGPCIDCSNWDERSPEDRCPLCVDERFRRRDEFARYAIIGVMARSESNIGPKVIAREAWDIADAMLEKQPPAAAEDGK